MNTLRFIERDGKKILQERILKGDTDQTWFDVPEVTEPEQRKPMEFKVVVNNEHCSSLAILSASSVPNFGDKLVVVEKLPGYVMIDRKTIEKAIYAHSYNGQRITFAHVEVLNSFFRSLGLEDA